MHSTPRLQFKKNTQAHIISYTRKIYLICSLTNQSNTSFNPMAYRFFCSYKHWQDIVRRMSCGRQDTSSFHCFIYRAFISSCLVYIGNECWLQILKTLKIYVVQQKSAFLTIKCISGIVSIKIFGNCSARYPSLSNHRAPSTKSP